MPNEVVAGLLLSVDAKTINARREIEALRGTMRETSRDIRAELSETRAGMKQIGEEIGINLNRHLISFLAKIPGADIFAKAFPVAAIVGVGAAFAEAGVKVYEFIKRNDEAAQKINEAFGEMHQASKLATDELAVTNDKLEEQIAKLTNQRPNRLKTALDEARVAADKLVESIARSNKEIESLLQKKENQVSFLGGFLLFKMNTKGADDIVKKQETELAELAEHYQHLADAATTAGEREKINAEGRAAVMAKEKVQLRDTEDLYNYITAQRNSGALALDPGAFLGVIGGRGHQLDDMVKAQEEEGRQAVDQGKKKTLEQVSDRLRDLEHQDEVRRVLHGKSVEEEVLYWQQYIGAFTVGSNEWLAVQRKYQDEVAAQVKNFSESKLREPMKKFREEQLAPVPADVQKDVGAEMMADFGHYSKAWDEYNHLLLENSLIHTRLQGSLEITNLRIAAGTGHITKQQAAFAEAQKQLEVYKAEQEAISKEIGKQIGDVRGDTSLTEAERQTKLQQLQNKLDEITGQVAIKQAETKALGDGLKLRDSMAVMFSEWIDRSQDVRAELAALWNQFSSSMNDEMAKAITGSRTNWSGAFRGLAQSTVKFGLGNIEGALMKHIHFPGGGQTTGRMDVQAGVVNIAGPGAGGGAGMPGDPAQAVASMTSKPWSTALRFIGGLLGLVKLGGGGAVASAPVGPTDGGSWGDFDVPAMAFGGPVLAGHAYDVGEMGRERFVPDSDGHIVPNHQLTGGGNYYDVHVEGSWSAQARQDMQRMLARVHGSAVQNAMLVQQERRRRVPNRN